ncbi:hypothetical protein D3C81_2228420 [compost metagenome]
MPKPNNRGTVPSEKTNIEAEPTKILPVPSAYNCAICKGPQGIKPLNKPNTIGL